jgi:Ser/Thr protein kinase RdoA (MazF antagonist)
LTLFEDPAFRLFEKNCEPGAGTSPTLAIPFGFHIFAPLTALQALARSPEMPPSDPSIPSFTKHQAEALALNSYGLKSCATALPSYRDQNFLLEDAAGARYVLKLANRDEQASHLEGRQQALDHLALSPLKGRVPELLRPGGKPMVLSSGGHWMRLLSFVPGQPLSAIKSVSAKLHEAVARFLGRLDRALEGFDHPSLARPFRWNLMQFGSLAKYLPCIRDSKRRKLVETYFEAFEDPLFALLSELRTATIHNDANDHNILVNNVDGDQQIGIIDFGDLIKAPLICELAIAATYSMLGSPKPIELALSMTRAYHEVYPLQVEERRMLFPLVCLRLCSSVLISSHDQQSQAPNEYLTTSQAPAWRLLECFASRSSKDIEARFCAVDF